MPMARPPYSLFRVTAERVKLVTPRMKRITMNWSCFPTFRAWIARPVAQGLRADRERAGRPGGARTWFGRSIRCRRSSAARDGSLAVLLQEPEGLDKVVDKKSEAS
jgi:hypothetical protein